MDALNNKSIDAKHARALSHTAKTIEANRAIQPRGAAGIVRRSL